MHTPGPWTNDDTGKVYPQHVIRKNGVVICRLPGGYIAPTDDEIHANARLIAQAPAMLALMQDIDQTWDDESPKCVVRKARAILRAVGG